MCMAGQALKCPLAGEGGEDWEARMEDHFEDFAKLQTSITILATQLPLMISEMSEGRKTLDKRVEQLIGVMQEGASVPKFVVYGFVIGFVCIAGILLKDSHFSIAFGDFNFSMGEHQHQEVIEAPKKTK